MPTFIYLLVDLFINLIFMHLFIYEQLITFLFMYIYLKCLLHDLLLNFFIFYLNILSNMFILFVHYHFSFSFFHFLSFYLFVCLYEVIVQ